MDSSKVLIIRKLMLSACCCSICGCSYETFGLSDCASVGDSESNEAGWSRFGRHCIVGD